MMTSVEFYEKMYKVLHDQNHRISFCPAEGKNYMMDCNGHFVGGLFNDELCLVYSNAVKKMLNDPEPVYRGSSKNAQHRMFVIPLDIAKEALHATYEENHSGKDFVYDITHTSRGAAFLEDFYDHSVVFLKFCSENNMLKKYPLDKRDRIVVMTYYKNDLTEDGLAMFEELLQRFLTYYDRGGKTDLTKMLERWHKELQVKRSQ